MANCIEFVVQDSNGGIHGGMFGNKPGDKEIFDEEKLEEFREKLMEEGFHIIEIKLTTIH